MSDAVAAASSKPVSTTPDLENMLREMDIALADEIAKVKSSEGSGRAATDGVLVSELGGHYTYTFKLNDHWEPADDTPIMVKVRGSDTIRGTVVTASGSTISIATDSRLPDPVPDVTLHDDPVQLLERLRDALKATDEGGSLLGSKAFLLTPFSSGKLAMPPTFPGEEQPYTAQLDAIRTALASEVTFVIGPPGTGKTATLARMAYALADQGRTVLIAAHTNIAVDNAILEVAKLGHNGDLAPLRAGRVIRYGTPQLARVKGRDDIYPPKLVKRQAEALDRQRTKCLETRRTQLDRLQLLTRQRESGAEQWRTERAQLIDQRDRNRGELRPLQARERERLAHLDQRIGEAMTALSLAEQRETSARNRLGRLVADETRAETAHANHLAMVKDLTQRLATAQQTHAILRLVKGMNATRLADQLGAAKQQAWKDEQSLSELHLKVDRTHRAVAKAEEEATSMRVAHEALAAQRQLPSVDSDRIAELQLAVAEAERGIAAGEAHRRQLTDAGDAEDRILRRSVEDLGRQIGGLDEQIRGIEKQLLQNAQVVATTLSKVYMDETLRKRRFDVVILDEMSMAPLPAVYVAASHADQSVVAIGDPRQLPPIAKAKTAMAGKWLNRDLFSVAGVDLDTAVDKADGRAVLLDTQFRMHPDVAAVSNKHVYDNRLQNGLSPDHGTSQGAGIAPIPDKALVLCDTSDAAPVTTRPGGQSRINFYHAMCSISAARQALATLPPPSRSTEDDQPRVGIVTPYAPQARLIHRMLKAEQLDAQVRAGTVHKFQGLEFEVIIFDTVESPPIPPYRDFIGGGRQGYSTGMRLINVAITRPKHKLIIIANRKYVDTTFQPSDTLRQAVTEAGQAASMPSRGLLGLTNLSGEAAEKSDPVLAIVTQNRPYDIEWLDESSFYPRLISDMRQALERIVIFSPFVRIRRTEMLINEIAGKCDSGIRTVVVASEPEKGDRKFDDRARTRLERAGVEFRTSPAMHEKLVLIDNDILYFGSLNPLSHNATTELMQRAVSRECVRQVERLLSIDARIAQAHYGPDYELSVDHLTNTTCPRCRGTMRPKFGKYDIFYGCTRYPKCEAHYNVPEAVLAAIPILLGINCEHCKHGKMRPRANGTNLYLECGAPAPCTFRRKIVILPKVGSSQAAHQQVADVTAKVVSHPPATSVER